MLWSALRVELYNGFFWAMQSSAVHCGLSCIIQMEWRKVQSIYCTLAQCSAMQSTQCIAGCVAIMGLGRLHPQLQCGGPESQQPPSWHLQKMFPKIPKIKLLQKDILSNKQNWHLQEMSPKRKKKKKLNIFFMHFNCTDFPVSNIGIVKITHTVDLPLHVQAFSFTTYLSLSHGHITVELHREKNCS